jgi:hypothetical protein
MAFTCPICTKVSHHPKDEEYGYCGHCHDFTGPPKPSEEETGVTFWVQGIVAARNRVPYVQIANAQRLIAQLTIAQARNVAHDILTATHNAEADAMVVKFFSKLDLPDGALGAFMQEFRDFRHELEMEKVETSRTDPDTGEKA